MLSVRNLRKVYTSKKAESVVALDNVSIDFPETGMVFLLGKSGSGKSTLLNAIGGLDKFDGGEIIIKGKSSKDFTQADFDSYRNTFIGFIFQEYNILENFTVAKNLALALELQGKKADKQEVMRLLNQVEMQAYANRRPNELSGGQKQRVAIARALIKNPEIIMADEPTGALDSNTGKQVMDTLKELSKTKLIIVVSHDREFAEFYGDRIIELKDGRILHDTTRKEVVAEETKSGIKIIDDDIVYIKKGQEFAPNELKVLGEIIAKKSQTDDTFISFNKEANARLKEGAKINDDGNKEKFFKTEPEDVKTKQYNANSLKLIKSHLGFKDSFKMGASSLKNKVGKLVFTILLSFFAFTCFGIIDALSQWNRASSVYDAMKINNVKTIVAKKELKKGSGMSSWHTDKQVSETDIEYFQQEYKDYTFIPVVGNGYLQSLSLSFDNGLTYSSFSAKNEYKQPAISGYVNVTNEQLSSLGFTMEVGHLPTSDDEIAISKFMLKNIITLTEGKSKTITKASDLINKKIQVDNVEYTIVGIVDDKTEFKKYSQMDDAALDKASGLDTAILYSPVSFGYVTSAKFQTLKNSVGNERLYMTTTEVTEGTGYVPHDEIGKNDIISLEKMYQLRKTQINGTSFYYNSDKNYLIKDNNLYTNDSKYEINEYFNYNGWMSSSSIKKSKKFSNGGSESVTKEEFLSELGLTMNTSGGHSYSLTTWLNENHFVKINNASSYTEEMFLLDCFQFFGEVNLLNAEPDVNGSRFKDLADNQAIMLPRDSTGIEQLLEQAEAGNLKAYVYDSYPSSSDSEIIKSLTCIGFTNFYNYDTIYRIDNPFITSVKNRKDLGGYFGAYSCMMTSLTGSSTDEKLIRALESHDDNGIRFAVQNDTTYILDMLEEIITSVASVFMYIAIAFAVFAALMLMNFISTSINYKKREIGVLRALGARGSDVFGIFLNESMLIAVINFTLAAIATIAGCKIINSAIINSIGYSISLLNVGIRQIILILAVSCGSAILASLIPTSKISKKKPIDAINNR